MNRLQITPSSHSARTTTPAHHPIWVGARERPSQCDGTLTA